MVQTRPDGTIQFAENPPKQYQDIFHLHFEDGRVPRPLERAARGGQYWIDHGIRIFRVDNPHTKPFLLFWKWLISGKASYPETIFPGQRRLPGRKVSVPLVPEDGFS